MASRNQKSGGAFSQAGTFIWRNTVVSVRFLNKETGPKHMKHPLKWADAGTASLHLSGYISTTNDDEAMLQHLNILPVSNW